MNIRSMDQYFHHPFFSVFFWFTSMGLCLPIYLLFMRKISPEPAPDSQKSPMPIYISLFPALCDVIGSSMNLIGMSLVYGSIY